MTDKEHEGIEKEQNTPDVEVPEDGIQMTGTVTGKGQTEDKSEQQASSAGKLDEEIQTIFRKNYLRSRKRNILYLIKRDFFKWIMYIMILAMLAITFWGCLFIIKVYWNNNHRLENIYIDLSGLSLETIANIAITVAPFLTFFTLIEMKIERNNAYRPDVVVVPRLFEGGKVGIGNFEVDKKYIYINPDSTSPGLCYVGSSFVDMHSLLHDSKYEINKIKDKNLLYIEAPYISFKNIGRGTAKNIHISISNKWLKRVLPILIENSNGEIRYGIEYKIGGDDLVYYGPDNLIGWTLASMSRSSEDYDANIAYLASGEDTVHMALPKDWNRVLAVLFSQMVRERNKTSSGALAAGTSSRIPEPVITIRYKDMQGKKFKKRVSIPWNIRYSFDKSNISSDEVEKTMYISTGFYTDYIR